jgi:probable DNA metabolism protein
MDYLMDGTYSGFLTCLFESFERKEIPRAIYFEKHYQPNAFDEHRVTITDETKAQRVHEGLIKRIGKERSADFYRNFLSEDLQAWNAAFRIACRLFNGEKTLLDNYGDSDVMLFHLTLKKVSRERHRMKAFIRFSKSSDGLFYAIVEPDFNVLPLIITFFRNRYADQPWLIYDVKRGYGMLYDKHSVQEVTMNPVEESSAENLPSTIALDEKDELYQHLWKQYFKSTNIVARKNMKLHLRHVPRRYWKYLAEKQP